MQDSSDQADREIEFHREVAARERAMMTPTPQDLLERYRQTAHWKANKYECVIKWLKDCQPRHIADFGCGSGEMATRLGLMGFRVTGFDLSPELVEAARHRARLDGVSHLVDFEVCGPHGEGMPDDTFDGVLAMAVLHHTPFPEGVDTLARILKPGGHAAILEPVAYSRILQRLRDLMPVSKEVSPDERQLGDKDIADIKNRFDIVQVRHFYLLHRLRRFPGLGQLPGMDDALQGIDSWLLGLPGISRFAGTIVMLARKAR